MFYASLWSRKQNMARDTHHLKVTLIESLYKFMQSLGWGDEKSPRVCFVTVRSDECGAPGAESAISKEFHAANGEAFVETIVDKARYLGLGAQTIIGGRSAHQIELDLPQSVHNLGRR